MIKNTIWLTIIVLTYDDSGQGHKVLLDADTPVLKMLLIDGGELVFDDKDVKLNAENILITNGGLLQVSGCSRVGGRCRFSLIFSWNVPYQSTLVHKVFFR